MPKSLCVADGVEFPLDAITQSIALLAVRRAGKSNAAAVLAEEMYRAGLPWVAIDPKGDWWGLRSSADGTGDGLPIPIFGGLHGDMPLAPEAGHLIAELIVEENLTCVLDVSEFASKAAQMRFLTDLAERLFRLHGRHPQPRHLFLEEADDFVPQRVQRDQARCVGAWTKVVKQGGSRGLGITLISQRSAVVNKDALTQTETLIALRTTSPQDRKAIMEWVSYHDVARELVDSLPGLDDGEAWVCSPHWLGKHGQPAIQRLRFRRRSTFDSGATPTMRQQRKPATITDIDLTALHGRMEAVVEKAAQDDPKALRRKVAELERKLAAGAGAGQRVAALEAEVNGLRAELAAALARPAEQVQVPTLGPDAAAALERSAESLRAVADVVGGHVGSLTAALARAQGAPPPAPAAARPPAQRAAPARTPPPARPRSSGDNEPSGDIKPSKAERAVLNVLAQFPDGLTKVQVALLSGYSVKSSSLGNALSQLRTWGLIERGQPLKITPDGVAFMGDDIEPVPEGAALVEYWLNRLGRAEAAVLRVHLAAWPDALAKGSVADRSGYSVTSSSLGNALSRLRALELISGYGETKADDALGEHAQGMPALSPGEQL
jgi:hypothetical protein